MMIFKAKKAYKSGRKGESNRGGRDYIEFLENSINKN
jgi:hypothetical protein